MLEGKGLIRFTRSHVRILDRDGLPRAANGFYGVPEAEYARSIGPLAGESSRVQSNPRAAAKVCPIVKVRV